MDELINRPDYLNYLIELNNQNSIKILTGIRRSGKTSLLKLLINYFKETGVSEENIIHLNLTSLIYEGLTYKDLYQMILSKYKGERLYLFIDEIQVVKDWQKAINSLFEDINCSIYLTGSNSELFSDDFANRLSGRYILVEVLPLSFKEFLEFKGLKVISNHKEYSGFQFSVLDENEQSQNLKELFYEFVQYGGMPEIVLSDSEKIKIDFLDSIFLSVFVRDIENYLETVNSPLLQRLIRFLVSSIGNRLSVNKLKNFLISNHWIKPKTHSEKIQQSLDAIIHAFLFYPVRRFDISGKKELTSLGKYYITDTGIKNSVLEFQKLDRGSTLENIVFLELKRRGYKVHTGKIGQSEINFRIIKDNRISYIQVSESLSDDKVKERELKPLKNLKNAYRRMIITYENDPFLNHIDGIDIVNIIDFLLDENILN